MTPTKDKIELSQWEIAARQLIESHDRGDLDGEARGWIMLRTLLAARTPYKARP